MSTHLDLDDLVSRNPQAQKELEELRAQAIPDSLIIILTRFAARQVGTQEWTIAALRIHEMWNTLVQEKAAPTDAQEPVAWRYRVNNAHTEFGEVCPPDDSYDEGSLTPLYAAIAQEKANVR